MVDTVLRLAGDIGVHAEARLTEVGVDSIAFSKLSSRLRELTGLRISPALSQRATPRRLASHLLDQAMPTTVSGGHDGTNSDHSDHEQFQLLMISSVSMHMTSPK